MSSTHDNIYTYMWKKPYCNNENNFYWRFSHISELLTFQQDFILYLFKASIKTRNVKKLYKLATRSINYHTDRLIYWDICIIWDYMILNKRYSYFGHILSKIMILEDYLSAVLYCMKYYCMKYYSISSSYSFQAKIFWEKEY